MSIRNLKTLQLKLRLKPLIPEVWDQRFRPWLCGHMKKSKRRGYFSPPQVINMQFLLTISVYIHWQSDDEIEKLF